MPDSDAAAPRRTIECSRLDTDRPGEIVELTRASCLPNAQFWRVEHSDRHWSAVHDTYTACLVHGPGDLSARWSSRGEERPVTARDIQLMEPGEVHRTTFVSRPASFFVVFWAPELVASAARELDFRFPVRFACAQSASRTLRAALETLARSLAAGTDELALQSAFAEATRELLFNEAAAGDSAPRRQRHPSVRRAIELLSDAFAHGVSLDDLARATRMSKFHVARSFRQATGVAPHQYQSLLRLQAARRHLERGVSVEESAALSGFSDGPHLTRAFRKWVGVSPGSWARAAKPVIPRGERPRR